MARVLVITCFGTNRFGSRVLRVAYAGGRKFGTLGFTGRVSRNEPKYVRLRGVVAVSFVPYVFFWHVDCALK